MNKKLFGKVVLVGRDQKEGGLCLAMSDGGKILVSRMGMRNSVPKTVSRCLPETGTAHCSISIGYDGSMLLQNLKTQNTTYVDGYEIFKKYIGANSRIELGHDRYPVDASAIIEAASRMIPGEIIGGGDGRTDYRYEFLDVKQAYIDYQKEVGEIKAGAIKRIRLPGILATLVPAVIGLLFVIFSEDITLRIVSMSVGSVLSGLVGILMMGRSGAVNSEVNEQVIELQIKYQPRYCCPKCGMKYPFTTHWRKLESDGGCPNPKCDARFV